MMLVTVHVAIRAARAVGTSDQQAEKQLDPFMTPTDKMVAPETRTKDPHVGKGEKCHCGHAVVLVLSVKNFFYLAPKIDLIE